LVTYGNFPTGSVEVKMGLGGPYLASDDFTVTTSGLAGPVFHVSADGFSATSPTVIPWAPGPCGILLDTAQGLELNGAVLVASAAVSSLGGITDLLYDDGYVYFIDGNGEIGKLPAR
jgi:hypothetical protein